MARLFDFIKNNYNIEIKGLKPNDMDEFKKERAKIDQAFQGE
jgi:hypothetical protein